MKIDLIPYDVSNKAEAQELHSIIRQYYENSPWPPTVEKIMQGGTKYFRALLEGQQFGITGYVMKTPTLAETVKTTVFREWRGKGLGNNLSLAIEEECKKAGIKKVMTTIYHFNNTMISIKLKQGYLIEGFHPDHEAPGFHEYSMGKTLR